MGDRHVEERKGPDMNQPCRPQAQVGQRQGAQQHTSGEWAREFFKAHWQLIFAVVGFVVTGLAAYYTWKSGLERRMSSLREDVVRLQECQKHVEPKLARVEANRESVDDLRREVEHMRKLNELAHETNNLLRKMAADVINETVKEFHRAVTTRPAHTVGDASGKGE